MLFRSSCTVVLMAQAPEPVEDDAGSVPAEFIHSATPAVAGALVAAAIGTALAGPAGAALGGVTGAIIPEIAKAVEEYQKRAGRSADLVVSWTSELTGMSPADLHV